jgi:hypothetical protein
LATVLAIENVFSRTAVENYRTTFKSVLKFKRKR